MNDNSSTQTLNQIKLILGTFLGILILYLMRELSNLIVPLFFALFFAVLLQPLVRKLTNIVPVNIAVIITTLLTLLLFLFIGFGLFNVIQTLLNNSDAILENISNDVRPLINRFTSYLGITFEKGELRSGISELLQSSSFWSVSGTFFSSLSGFAAELLITILYFAGILGAITRYDQTVNYLVGSKNAEDNKKAKDAFIKIKESIGSYIEIKTYVSLLTGLISGIICWAFGVEYAVLWGFLAFVLNYIPYIGSLIAVIPPVIFGIIDFDNYRDALILFLCLEAVQLTMGNVVEPRWMGGSFSINTVSVLFGFVFWAFMWGASGMLLAVPLTFMLKVIFENLSGADVLVRLMEKKKL